MTEGFYTDPKHARKMRPKIACITVSYLTSHIRNYGHFSEDKRDSIARTIAAYKHFEAGADFDFYVVNHGGFESTDPFVNVINAPNFGFSFGGYKQAWEILKDEYDFFLFHEDDIAPSQDGWLLRIVEKFLSKGDIGAVGNFVEGRSMNEAMSDQVWARIGFEREMMYNFDGAFTFTSNKILKWVEDIGGLIVLDCSTPDTPPTMNEIIFQQPILELGYRIVSFDGFVVHGSEIFTGDVANRSGLICPMMNINGRRNIPEVAEIYDWHEQR